MGHKRSAGGDTDVSELAPALQRLRDAWQASKPDEAQRRNDLQRLRDALKRRLDDMANAISADFGHRSREESVIADGMTVLNDIDHLIKHLRRWMKPSRVGVGWRFLPARAQLRPSPVGVVGVIAPWNYPVNLSLIPLATAIAAGNHVYLKPSEHTPRTSAFLRALLAEVFPPDRVAVATGGAEIGSAFAGLPFDHLVFTGSTAVGRKVMAAAAPNLTPLTLELGGKSANIVFDDADLDAAAKGSTTAFTWNSGQWCAAGTRLLVQENIYERFLDKLVGEVAKLKVGPQDDSTSGPITTQAQFEKIQSYFDIAAREGLKPAIGGKVKNVPGHEDGWYIEPTVYANVTNDMTLAQEEIFGPIVCVIPFKDEADALRIANDSEFGLGAGIWSQNIGRVHRVAAGLEAGRIVVNEYSGGFVQTPCGGFKQSGYGREQGVDALSHYTQLKSVIIRL